MTAFSRVSPWLLWIVIAHAGTKGSWVLSWGRFNFSQKDLTGIIGTQSDSISCRPKIGGPKK